MLTTEQTGGVVGDGNNSSATPPLASPLLPGQPGRRPPFSPAAAAAAQKALLAFSAVTSSARQASTKHFHTASSPWRQSTAPRTLSKGTLWLPASRSPFFQLTLKPAG